MMKLSTMRERHAREVRELVREALLDSDWTLPRAAAALGCSVNCLQKLLVRHPKLAEERERRRKYDETGAPIAE